MREWTLDQEGCQHLIANDNHQYRLCPKDGLWIPESKGAHSGIWWPIYGNIPVDESKAKLMCEEIIEHHLEETALNRQMVFFPNESGSHTPWGPTQQKEVYAEGVAFHSTASHGGIQLSADRNAKVPEQVRSSDGWYEEDCAWACVAITFPELFTAYERRHAELTMERWYQEEWSQIRGVAMNIMNMEPAPAP